MAGIWQHRTIEAAFPRLNMNAQPARVARCFRGFLEAHPLTVVDVGARGGATPEIAPLAHAVHLVVLEADEEAAGRLHDELRGVGFRSVNVICAAAGPNGGRHRLHVTRDPGKSSLFEPNRGVIERYGEADAYRVVEDREIETQGLQELLLANGVGSPDLLKADVQGFELEVLRSAAPAPLDRLLLVEAEVEFVELYSGQPLFRHVDDFLSGHGFELFNLSRTFANYAGARWQPYGRGQIQFADASYLRTQVDGLSSLELGKLVILASYYGFTDYGYFLYRENEERLGELGETHIAAFREFFSKFSRRGPHGLSIPTALTRAVLDRLLFHYLCWRRWNGLKTDTDRAYPVR